ncbi:MAG: hypothetical protein U0892_14700 [Pirellulales bacterium]
MSSDAAAPSELANKLGDVRAGVRPNLEISRHIFSGVPTYVVRDPVTAQTHRFSVQDYQLFIAIDQTRTLKDSVAQLIERKQLAEEDSESFYKFVVHLHQLGLLSLPLGDGSSLYKRHKTRLDAAKRGALLKLLFMKVPLVKPDTWLSHNSKWFAPIFTRTAFCIWLVALAVCGAVLLVHWKEFISPLGTMLAVSNVPTLWFLLVTLKAFHELGHAFACKRFGGQVPEMGAMIMMGTPCAYVDASSSWGFPNRMHRMIVALAGMYFESIAAMVALAIWLLTDTGRIHSAAQYAIVLSTVVTIGFNANPLMRYDGYFVFCDLINVPNLHRDAKAAVTAFIKRVFFGLPMPATDWVGKRRVAMIIFGGACMLYSCSVTIGIATLFLLSIPVFGPAVALFVSGLPVSRFVIRIVKYIFTSQETAPVRRRAVLVTSLSVATLLIAGLAIPLPGRLQVQGAIHRLSEVSIRSGVDGFIVSRPVQDGDQVKPDQPILKLENQELRSHRAELESQIRQLTVQMSAELRESAEKAEQTRVRLHTAREDLQALDAQLVQLNVQSNSAGELMLPGTVPEIGKFVHKGEPLGTVASGPWTVKSHLTAEQWADITKHLDDPVYVRLNGAPGRAIPGRIVRASPIGRKKIEDAALTHLGGGDIAVSPEMTAGENFFEVLVELESEDIAMRPQFGMTAVVNLHGEMHTVGHLLINRTMRLIHQIRQVGIAQ